MKMKNNLTAIVLATVWISISEFLRNEFLLKHLWVEQYQEMRLVFASEPMNGANWGLWSSCFAVGIFIISRKFSLFQTFLLSWFVGFVFMWLVVGNLGVLPFGILPVAIPLSLLETVLAVYLVNKFSS